MKMLLTIDRVRSLADGARSEKELENLFRRNKVRFTWTTEPGFLAARVPVRSGSVLVYRTCSRSAPFRVRSASPSCVAPYPYPVPRFSWDD